MDLYDEMLLRRSNFKKGTGQRWSTSKGQDKYSLDCIHEIDLAIDEPFLNYTFNGQKKKNEKREAEYMARKNKTRKGK